MKKKVFIGLIIIVLLLCAAFAGYILLLSPMIDATKEYNAAIEEFNKVANKYNDLAQTTCVSNIEGFDDSIVLLNPESEVWTSVLFSMIKGNNTVKIAKDISTIDSMKDYILSNIPIMEQITNPSVSWVEGRLKQVQSVGVFQHVTDNYDPNGLLGKEGGYTGCIYFSIIGLNASGIKGDHIIDKGTDGGGAIEIYATLKEAEDRCDYFAGLDGTILYSGSYAIVGTMVIRTSFMLSYEDQFRITNEITEALTDIDK